MPIFIAIIAFMLATTAMLFLLLKYQYYKLKVGDEYKSFGNAAQIVSAVGAFLFGVASVATAVNIYLLQDRSRLDNEMGRTTDLLIKFEQNKTAYFDDYAHSGACMAYIADLFGEKEFDTVLVNSDRVRARTQHLFSPQMFNYKQDAPSRTECLTLEKAKKDDAILDPFSLFYRRVILTLNNYESVLFDWSHYRDTQSKELISDQIADQICKGPTARLFTGHNELKHFHKIMTSGFPQLSVFVAQCDDELLKACIRQLERMNSSQRPENCQSAWKIREICQSRQRPAP